MDNARRDKSILYNRVCINILVYSSLLASANLYVKALSDGVGLFAGLFHVTYTSKIFLIFIFFISGIILQLTAFYPRKVWVPEYSRFNQMVLDRFMYNTSKILNKMGEQFKINEFPIIILFILTGVVLWVSSISWLSILLSLFLLSYGLYILSTIIRFKY